MTDVAERVKTYQQFINGEWVDSASGETIEVENPANDVQFGLAASVWTADAGRGMRVAKAIQFGTVWINDHFMLVSEMPHGGFKESGYGKDQSMYAVEDYTVVKHVMLKIEH